MTTQERFSLDVQNTALLFVLAAAILCVVSFIAGFGHELARMERAYGPEHRTIGRQE